MATQNDPWRAAWAEVHVWAWSKLHRSDTLPRPIPNPPEHAWLELWHDRLGAGLIGQPSDPISLSVFQPPHREWVVRRAVWHRSADLARLSQEVKTGGPVTASNPTITVTDALVDRAGLLALIEEAQSLTIPLAYASAVHATDTDRAGFAIANFDRPPSILRLEWGLRTAPWAGVYEWYDRTWRFLERCFPPPRP